MPSFGYANTVEGQKSHLCSKYIYYNILKVHHFSLFMLYFIKRCVLWESAIHYLITVREKAKYVVFLF